MDGENLRYGSSGTRLLLTLLGILLDERFSVILIDEPEIGLSPTIQAALARFLYNSEQRKQLCPHLRQIYIATHSHLFLDRADFSNNHVVTKAGGTISIKQVESVGDLHQLQFNLLGNTLEALYLPSALVVVEGTTDHRYLERVIGLAQPDRRVTVIPSQGNVKRKVHELRETLGDLWLSPFRSRLFVVLDSTHQPGLTADLKNLGVQAENVITWDRNGIEYVYPPEILREIGSPTESVGDMAAIGGERGGSKR